MTVSSYISRANLLLTVPVILTLYVIFRIKNHWTAVVHINSSDTYAYSAGVYYVVLLEGDVIVRTYVHGRKGSGPSALVFHVFQDGCSLYSEHFCEFVSINPQFNLLQ